MENGHVSKVGVGLQTLQQIIPALVPDDVHSLCLHGNDISRIECLSQLQALRDLNLSANAIVVMEGLQNLHSLRSLNLASNRIQSIEGLQGLDQLQSLNLAHNFISSLSGLGAVQGGQLSKLDLRDNLLSSLQELAVLAGLPNLRELALAGGSPGNSICAIPSYRAAVAAALPQLELLDGQPLQAERQLQPGMQPAAAAQHIASLQLQAFQAPPPGPAALLPPPPPCPEAALDHFAPHANQGMPIIVHHMGVGQDQAQSIADRLVQRLAQSGVVQSLWGDQLPNGQDAAAREGRMASLESRLTALLDERLRPPLEPIEVKGRAANGDQEGVRRKRVATEKQSSGPVRESGALTLEDLPDLEKLQRELERSRRDLERRSEELQHKATEMEDQRIKAEKELHAVHAEYKATVLDIKQHANKVLKQMQRELLEAKQCTAELQAQARGALDREQSALQRAEQLQGRVTVLEAEVVRARGDSADAATAEAAGLRHRLQEAELAWLKERQQLNHELANSKEALQVAQQQVEHLQDERRSAAAEATASVDAAKEQARQQVAQAERRFVESCEKLEAAAVEREELRALERQAMRRAQELSELLLESQAKAQALEEDCRSKQAQLEECGRERERCMADSAAQLRASSEAQAAAQKALAATETDFRIAVQEGKREAEALREKAQAAAAEATDLRHALQTASAKLKEQEAALSEVTDMAQRQKACIVALNKERADLAARSADPAQVAALRSEAAQLHERLRNFTSLKSRAAEEQKLREGVEAELQRVQGELQEQQARAEQQAAEDESRLADAHRGLQAAEERAAALSKDVDDARCATKVKEAMLRSANESIAQLTAALEDAQRDACDAAAAAAHTEKEAAARQAEAGHRQRALRQELEALEGALEEAMAHARSAEQKANEKDEMLQYVAEEVDRVKALFGDKERRLIAQRDEALHAHKDAAARVAALQEEASSAARKVSKLETHLGTQPQQLEAAQEKARAAEESATQHREEAVRAAKRVAEVEREMRSLLSAMERQKKASALKMQQLASVVHDLQRPFLSWAPSM